jgi:hypothetical protein
MAKPVTKYDFGKVAVSIGGIPLVEFNESDFITIEPMIKPHSDKRSQPQTDSASDDGQLGPDKGTR